MAFFGSRADRFDVMRSETRSNNSPNAQFKIRKKIEHQYHIMFVVCENNFVVTTMVILVAMEENLINDWWQSTCKDLKILLKPDNVYFYNVLVIKF